MKWDESEFAHRAQVARTHPCEEETITKTQNQ
jgi:hypothetical protein